jgi:chitinase
MSVCSFPFEIVQINFKRYKQVNDLKQQNPKLKTLLAMGGWTAGSLAYSNMASTVQNRKEFIDSSIKWLRDYNFDGLDMDWEYPANRDGKSYDKANFGLLCKVT